MKTQKSEVEAFGVYMGKELFGSCPLPVAEERKDGQTFVIERPENTDFFLMEYRNKILKRLVFFFKRSLKSSAGCETPFSLQHFIVVQGAAISRCHYHTQQREVAAS